MTDELQYPRTFKLEKLGWLSQRDPLIAHEYCKNFNLYPTLVKPTQPNIRKWSLHQAIDTSKESPYNMIGLYTLDLTVAWTEKDKLLAYKWFALIDPDEPQEGITVGIKDKKFFSYTH